MSDFLSRKPMSDQVDVRDIEARAQAVVALGEERYAAGKDWRIAQLDLFREVIGVARPALEYLGHRITIRWSATAARQFTETRFIGLQTRRLNDDEMPEEGYSFFIDTEGRLFLFS